MFSLGMCLFSLFYPSSTLSSPLSLEAQIFGRFYPLYHECKIGAIKKTACLWADWPSRLLTGLIDESTILTEF